MSSLSNSRSFHYHFACHLPIASLLICEFSYIYAVVDRFRPDMELGHWVTGSMGHLGHLSCPGHRVSILTRCETRFFSGFRKNAQNAKRTFEMLKWQKSFSSDQLRAASLIGRNAVTWLSIIEWWTIHGHDLVTINRWRTVVSGTWKYDDPRLNVSHENDLLTYSNLL